MAQELPNTTREVDVELEFDYNGVVNIERVRFYTDQQIVEKLTIIGDERWLRFKLACKKEGTPTRLYVDEILTNAERKI